MVDAVELFLSSFPEEIRAITLELRDMIRRTMLGAHEFLYYETVSYSLSSSPLGRICYISPMQKHVTLGFVFGASLVDQDHLLQGTGKRARHVKLKALIEARNPALKKLVRAAWTSGADLASRWNKERRQHRALMRKRVRAQSRMKPVSRSRRGRR